MRPASLIGMPTSCAMVLAELVRARLQAVGDLLQELRALRRRASRSSPRSAARAAATAASMSFSVPAGALPMTSPVPALCTSMVSLEEGATHWPLMKNLSRFRIGFGPLEEGRYCNAPPAPAATREIVRGSSQFRLLAERRFGPFFGTQFLGAFNDNVFKNALVILIAYQAASFTTMSSGTLRTWRRPCSSCRSSCSRRPPASSPTSTTRSR